MSVRLDGGGFVDIGVPHAGGVLSSLILSGLVSLQCNTDMLTASLNRTRLFSDVFCSLLASCPGMTRFE